MTIAYFVVVQKIENKGDDKMTLGERMKEYEKVSRGYLMKRTPVIVRLDRMSFSYFYKRIK